MKTLAILPLGEMVAVGMEENDLSLAKQIEDWTLCLRKSEPELCQCRHNLV